LNRKPISRFITATEPEYRSIAGDGTPYVFTDKEVRLTGFPRHDRLARIAREPRVLAADRLLLIMPTWRRELVGEATRPGGDRPANSGFWDSPFARSWLELLESERLRDLADRCGLRIAFVPHPDASAFLTRSFPSHIGAHGYGDVDLQELFARGATIVTDYSSNAFELAYLNRAVVYYQFDRDRFFSGRHVYRRGEWSYEHDGFGPVVDNPTAVLDELERLVEHGMTPQQPYATRMAEAFAFRDEGSCQRVVESILSARRPPDLVDSAAAAPD
jgi:CDP-glycerol glycerophosphotransferase (TagB/SpsB family)